MQETALQISTVGVELSSGVALVEVNSDLVQEADNLDCGRSDGSGRLRGREVWRNWRTVTSSPEETIAVSVVSREE